LLALAGAHHFVDVSRIRVKTLKHPRHGKVETPTGYKGDKWEKA
jgi:hypothetical protein